jgi:hypothetical protein
MFIARQYDMIDEDLVRKIKVEMWAGTAPRKEAPSPVGKRGRGRPRKPDSAKPWIAAGMSRASWYRHKAKPA